RRGHLPPGRPDRRPGELGRGLLDVRTPQHPGHAAGVRGGDRAQPEGGFAASSSIYGNAASYPTREDDRPAPLSPYGVTRLSCEHLARAYAASLQLDFAALRYFTIYGRRQRPDMGVARIVYALVDGEPFEIYGDADAAGDVIA